MSKSKKDLSILNHGSGKSPNYYGGKGSVSVKTVKGGNDRGSGKYPRTSK